MALLPGRTALVTDGGLIRAAIVDALDAPLALFWSIDISPASISELASRRNRPDEPAVAGWRLLRSNWTPPVPE
jgi:broad specificity phosphatase PhoE